MYYFCLYIIAISLVAIILTVSDKYAAKKGMRRISENSLMLTALLGGAAAMFYTMKIIRHKTLHKKFMIGLPVINVVHLIIITLLYLNS